MNNSTGNFSYCPADEPIWTIHVDEGINSCFLDTLTSTVIAGFILIAGTIELCIYRKYGNAVAQNQLTKSKLFILQILLTVFIPVVDLIRLILAATIYEDPVVYGYMVNFLLLTIVAYGFSLLVIRMERHYLLPSGPTRGHGIVLILFWGIVLVSENLNFLNLNRKDWWFQLDGVKNKTEFSLFVIRYVATLLLFVVGIKAPGIMQYNGYTDMHNESVENLVPPPSTTPSPIKNFLQNMGKLMPLMWPHKDIFLQGRVLFCFVLLGAGRVVNLYVQVYNKLIVNSLHGNMASFRWDWILIYVLFKFLQGGGTGNMGFLNNLRSFLWIRISQYTTRETEVELFRHLHNLSLRWHLSRKTGEVLRVMDRGTDSVNNLFNYIFFSIAPTLIDIVIAVAYFIAAFNVWFGVMVFVTMILYIAITVWVTEWRTKYVRSMNLADNDTRARSVDSLINFETVKYYGAEQYEVDAYREQILKFQEEEWKSNITLNVLNTAQNIIICGGLLAGSLYCAYLVVEAHTLTLGDYVLFSAYIVQLYMPLNWFGTYYRSIQRNFIDMENMLDLMKEDNEVIDAPGAGSLAIKRGGIEFHNVSFSYVPEKVVLRNITFVVPPGKSTALVGPSGSGKSTIIRLLFRFYDTQTGEIVIDGQNIKTITQQSLRRAIGVVPQDTVLFNNTIMFNIKYGRITATDADVYDAARGADIHDRILTFPQDYNTQVGERGLRLSGGEKQRVAIARTLLKAPIIILLDEATSALDTHTERNIQDSLKKMCANRTTLIVAHRLSTIIHVDEILVVKDGEIVERGRHEHLIGQEGVYAGMWKEQQMAADNSSADTSIEQSTSSRVDIVNI